MTDQTQAGDQQDKLSLDQIIEMMRSQYLKGFGESVVAIRRYNVDWPDERVAMDGAAMFVACAFSGMQTFSPKLEGGDLLFNAFRVIFPRIYQL